MATSFIPLHEQFHSTKDSTRHPLLLTRYFGCPLKYKNWNDERLGRACDAVHKGMAIRRAAEGYRVPRSTLHDHVSGRVQFEAKSGPKRYLNNSKELELVNFLSGVSSLGYSHTVKQVIEIVQSFVDKKGLYVTVSSS